MTNVYQHGTDNIISYFLSPDQAVIAAYEQFVCKNWNTWSYPKPTEHNGYSKLQHGHECNGFFAFNDGH
jgi:hypothetical protein